MNIYHHYRKIYINHYGQIPKDEFGRSYDIHHIDGNRNNNDPTNLIALSLKEHFDVHYAQGDYPACRLIANRLLKPHEKSKGKILSEEHKQKISNSLTGRKHSEETKKKIADANRGKSRPKKIGWRTHSEETKKKIGESNKKSKPRSRLSNPIIENSK